MEFTSYCMKGEMEKKKRERMTNRDGKGKKA